MKNIKSKLLKDICPQWFSLGGALLLLMLYSFTCNAATTVALDYDSETGEYYHNMSGKTINGSNTENLYLSADSISNLNISSFKVYDDGGKSGDYSSSCSSWFDIYVPEGYRLIITGKYDVGPAVSFYIYDGITTNSNKGLGNTSSSNTDLGTLVTSGNTVSIRFSNSGSTSVRSGIDITITLVHTVTLNNPSTGGSIASDTTYAKSGDTVTITASPGSGYAFEGLDIEGADGTAVSYTTTGANTVTFSMPNTNVTVAPAFIEFTGDGTAEDPYNISSKGAWNVLARLVSYGSANACAKLTADIDLGEGTYAGMIGTADYPYSGTFDGQGHTVTVNYTTYNSNTTRVAPFRYISGATIKNLNTAGTFNVVNKFVGGIVANAITSASTIENCRSSVVIASSVSGDGTHGGLVALVSDGATVAINDCIFDGSITGSSTTNCGGFIGWVANSGSTITNSLLAGTFNLGTGCYTFARNPNNVTVSNSYYLNALGTANSGATQVTAEQLSSGEVTYKLQNSRSEQVWGQTVGTDNTPQLTSDEVKKVYENTYGSGEANIYDNYIVISEDRSNANNITAYSGKTMPVKLVRTFAADTWNTLVLPFTLSTDEVNTAFGSDAKVAYFTNNTENTIELNYVETGANKAISANTPVLIRTTSAVSNPTFTKRDISSSTTPQVSGSNGINFVGSYAASYTIKEGEYFISGDKLWKSQGASTIKATRAYFTVPSGMTAKPSIRFSSGSTTGITSVEQDSKGSLDSRTVYSLSGQKVSDSLDSKTLPSGVYIVGGKKIVIR